MTTTISGSTGVNQITDDAITDAKLPAGSVLQVVSTTKTDTFSVSGNTYADVTGLTATITPTSTSSKIFVQVTMNLDSSQRYSGSKLFRTSTQIGMGAASGSRIQMFAQSATDPSAGYSVNLMHNVAGSILDSPATTSATTYKIQIGGSDTNGVTYLNRSSSDSNGSSSARGMSTITLMEIAG